MELPEEFNEAVAKSKLLPSKPDNETLLKLYALYKQATEGDNMNDAPANPFDIVAKAKYNAWSELKGRAKEDSMREYVQLVNRLKA